MFSNVRIILCLYYLFSILSCNSTDKIELPYKNISQIIFDNFPKKTTSVLINNSGENFELYPFNIRVFKKNGYQIDDYTYRPIVLDSLISNFNNFNLKTYEVSRIPYGKDSLKNNNQVYIECSGYYYDRKANTGVLFMRFLCGRLCGGECYFLFKGSESNIDLVESFCTIP